MAIIILKIAFKKLLKLYKKCYEQLELHKVELKGTILKPNMILPGSDSDEKIDTLKIAEMTIKCLEGIRSFRSSGNSLFIWWTIRKRSN